MLDSWKKDLLEVVDAEILPAFLGGKITDPDGNPLCLTIVSYFLSVFVRFEIMYR